MKRRCGTERWVTNEKALQYLAKLPRTGVKLWNNLKAANCHVCAIAKSRKESHPPSDRKGSSRRLELVHAGVWGKYCVESYSGNQYTVMFTDDMTRMRWIILMKAKDEVAEALKHLVKEVADPEGLHWQNSM